MINLLKKDARKMLFSVIIISIVITAVFWFNISSFTYNNYLGICHTSYKTPEAFSICMSPYWNQYTTSKPAIIISLGILGISTLMLLISELKRKLR